MTGCGHALDQILNLLVLYHLSSIHNRFNNYSRYSDTSCHDAILKEDLNYLITHPVSVNNSHNQLKILHELRICSDQMIKQLAMKALLLNIRMLSVWNKVLTTRQEYITRALQSTYPMHALCTVPLGLAAMCVCINCNSYLLTELFTLDV